MRRCESRDVLFLDEATQRQQATHSSRRISRYWTARDKYCIYVCLSMRRMKPSVVHEARAERCNSCDLEFVHPRRK